MKAISLVSAFILLMATTCVEAFFISWGTKVTVKTVKKGLMQCPMCACPTPYELKKIQNHFTMYWVPLWAEGESITYLECQQCKTSYNPIYFGFSNENENDEGRKINGQGGGNRA